LPGHVFSIICRLDELCRHGRAGTPPSGHMEMPMRAFLLAVSIVLLAAPAYSQGIDLSHLGEQTRSPADDAKNQKIDEAYKSATEKIPNGNAKVDPWHAMRSTSTSRNGQAKP
jgi:hypothetical protein